MLTDSFLHKRNIMHCFDRAAKTYDTHADLQHQVGLQLLQYLQQINHCPMRIADVGAGTGLLTENFSRLFPGADLFCVDLSPNMLVMCSKRLSQMNHQLICADFDALPFDNGSLDLIFSSMTLQWSFNLEITLTELLRCLKPGGILAFSLFVDDTLENFRSILNINPFYSTKIIETTLLSSPVSLLMLSSKKYYKNYFRLLELVKFFRQTGANYVINHNGSRYMKSANREILLTAFNSEKIAAFKVASCIVKKNL